MNPCVHRAMGGLFVMLVVLGSAPDAGAELYMYRDARGVPHFAVYPDRPSDAYYPYRPPTLIRIPSATASHALPATATATTTPSATSTATPTPTRTASPTEPARPPVVPPQTSDLNTEVLIVDGSGNEVFTRFHLDARYTYLAHVSGILNVYERGFLGGVFWRQADAEFVTENGNFTERNEILAFSSGATLVREDRATHRYAYELPGDGEKLSVRYRNVELGFFGTSQEALIVRVERADLKPSALPRYALYAAFLFIGVVALIKVIEIRAGRLKAEHERQAADRERAVQEALHTKRQEEKRRQELDRERRYRKLLLWYSPQTLLDDPLYVRQIALRDQKQIVARKDQILRDHLELHNDPLLIVMLQRRNPEIYRRMTISLELLRIAEWTAAFGEPFNLATYEAMDLYGDDSFVEEYARTYTMRLLEERASILAQHEAFHKDKAFITKLKDERPEIYRRATWKIRALSIAERLAAHPKHPGRGKPPDRQRREQDVRQEKVRQQETRDNDALAQAEARLRSFLRIKEIVDKYPQLSEDDKIQAEQALREALEEQNGNRTQSL